jgi:hypothetical protein
MSDCVYEKGGSKKYRLLEPYHDVLKVRPKSNIFLSYAVYLRTGLVCIRKGFEWDGPSGPAIDTDNFMDGSLVHDFLYGLIKAGYLKMWPYRLLADNEMFRQCKKDKMLLPRRIWTWLGVRIGGFWSAR